jgi:hypothetical protein
MIYLISQKCLEKKNVEKTTKNHLRSNDYEVDTAVARCFPNILDVIVLENINLSEDGIERPPYWSNDKDLLFYHQSSIYALNGVYFNCTLIPYVNWISKYSISERKLHALHFISCYELNSVRINLLISKGDG